MSGRGSSSNFAILCSHRIHDMAKEIPAFDFVVVLKHSNAKAIRLTGLILSILGIFILGTRYLREPDAGFSILFIIPCIIFLIWNLRQMRQNKPVLYWPILSLTGMGLILVPPFNILGLAFLLLARFEAYAMKATEIGFSKTRIRFSGMGGKAYDWSEVSNVILRDNILTIDFKNNRLFQKETDDTDDDAYDGSESEFNTFCREQLSLHGARQ